MAHAVDAGGVFAALDVDDQQDDAEQQANASDDDVRETEERILSAEQGRRRQDDLLGAVELAHGVGIVNLQRVISLR